MIKSFLELNSEEKIKVLDFISKSSGVYKSLEEFEDEVNNKICNYGEGIIFYFKNNEVKGKLSVILELVKKLKIVYINKIICPYEDKIALESLINEANVIAEKYEAEEVLLGIRDEKLLALAEKIGLKKSYSSFNMILKNKNNIYNTLQKVNLSYDNIEQYVDIYNRSFMDMPHGTFIELGDAKEYLDKKNQNEDHFIITNNNEKIGFLNTIIKDDKAFFDIGLTKEFRGKGYGKQILETAIEFLKEKNVENICLTVIEKNNIAFKMYKKRGFEIYEKLSDWIEVVV